MVYSNTTVHVRNKYGKCSHLYIFHSSEPLNAAFEMQFYFRASFLNHIPDSDRMKAHESWIF